MNKKLAYDIPTRLFHWLFAALFVGAFFIAKTFDDDSPQYPYHMMLGMTLSLTVLLRLVWGFIGSRYARFNSFKLNPIEMLNYSKQLISKHAKMYIGHNPASSWAALLMMGAALGLGFTGFMMAQDINKEFFEEIHELLANGFAIVAIAHVAGVIFHTIKHKDPIGLSMLHGKKTASELDPGITKTHGGVAILFLAIVGIFIINLVSNYDSTTRALNLFGTRLQLGDSENENTSNSESDNSVQSNLENDDDHDD